jgi:hypothetical protein
LLGFQRRAALTARIQADRSTGTATLFARSTPVVALLPLYRISLKRRRIGKKDRPTTKTRKMSAPTATTTTATTRDKKKGTPAPAATITVDGVQFERSNVRGIYHRTDKSAAAAAGRTAPPAFVDFQVILNEDDFRELERRKQAMVRLNRFNGVA